MPIQTQSADGAIHEFPDNTSPEAVDKAMKAYAEEHRDKTSTMEQVGRGMMDPAYGLGQLASHIMPEPPPIQSMEGKDINLTQAGDKITADREAGIQMERGGSQNIDWARMAGQALSPINYIGAGVGGAAIAPVAGKVLPAALVKEIGRAHV